MAASMAHDTRGLSPLTCWYELHQLHKNNPSIGWRVGTYTEAL
jgi:hypothetical protein